MWYNRIVVVSHIFFFYDSVILPTPSKSAKQIEKEKKEILKLNDKKKLK